MPREHAPITELSRAVARAARDAFGGTAVEVQAFYDEDESHQVSILWCTDAPAHGFTTYSTVTLHESSNAMDDKDIRVELAAVAPSGVVEFPNALATAAFCVIKDKWLAAPGVVFPDLLNHFYGLSTTLSHVMWEEPFPWPQLCTVELGETSIHWLLGIPISESEAQFVHREGLPKFARLLEENRVEYFDLNRAPMV